MGTGTIFLRFLCCNFTKITTQKAQKYCTCPHFLIPILLIAAFIFLSSALAPLRALSQNFTDPGAIPILIEPEFPKPGNTVTISIEDYGPTMARTKISWFVNGTLTQEGVGLRQFSTRVGELGSATTVLIRAGGNTRTVVLRPAHVDLLSEAVESYTPPFYRGKGLAAHGARVKIIAYPFLIAPNGAKIPAKDLVYTWSQNGTVLGNSSGYGRNAIIVANNSIVQQESLVTVTVASLSNETQASGAILVSPAEPEVIFYEDHPLLGIRYNQALPPQYSLEQDELTVLA